MKIQSLAVIFIIIILPISMILTSYIQNQVKTLSLQTSYDSKLNNATYDALKAFQLNTINSSTSDLSNSKLRDIEASVNSFFDSIASNFNMDGYNKDILKEYVPALVYTMYDGYYIYSPYKNTLDTTKSNEVKNDDGETEPKSDAEILNSSNENATYTDGEKLYGLKPYVYYSCRYVQGDIDVVINYSLDNYITVQGKTNEGYVYDYGYLISDCSENGTSAKYRNIDIEEEELKENIGDEENEENITYKKVNGVKYYKDEDTNTWFSYLNGEKYGKKKFSTDYSDAAVKYYTEAAAFKQRMVDYGLTGLTTGNAVDEYGNSLSDKFGNYEIFEFDGSVAIEEPNSNFNQHRLAVIRYSIEKNLSIAIANYNNYSGVTANFQMPKLKEDEWDKILNNISIISFLQGLNIGGKVYNGYSIINNTKNQEVVTEDSIYITADDGYYHKPTETDLNSLENLFGVLNIDFERKTKKDNSGNETYFYPNNLLGSYTSIVSQTNVDSTENIYDYLTDGTKNNVAKAYFTALGRERYSMYRTNNNLEVSIPVPNASNSNETVYNGREYTILSPSPGNGGIDGTGKKSMSISATFEISQGTDFEEMIVSTTQGSGWALRIATNSGEDQIDFEIHNGSEYIHCVADGKIEAGKKYNVIATYDGSTMKIYVNGVLKGKQDLTGTIITQEQYIPTMIGANPGAGYSVDGGYLNGTVYDVRLWYDVVLNNEQIEYIYSQQ